MSNRINIETYTNDQTGHQGYRIYDDYDTDSKTIFGLDEPQYFHSPNDDDMELLKQIVSSPYGMNPSTLDMFSFAQENEKGISIRGEYYEFEQWNPVYQQALTPVDIG